jgi:electron transport complex protein RnfB
MLVLSSNTPVPAPLVDQIEDLLPQTQCTKCGFPACRPYAEAVAKGDASYNQCPPGGAAGVARLANLLGKPVIPLNPANGAERPRPVALIDEALCIGCTLCIQACPVDAIIGAGKQMHTVVPSLCTGCDLCVAPCPVDCIAMVDVTGSLTGWDAWSQQLANDARERHDFHVMRLQREKAANDARLATKAAAKLQALEAEAAASPEELAEQMRKKAIVQAAIERARLKKEQMTAAAPAEMRKTHE